MSEEESSLKLSHSHILNHSIMKQVITFGCRLNAYESEVIKKNLEGLADENIAVFNTCAVTSEAERQARQAIRKYRKENPAARIVVTGCAAQITPAKYSAMPEVDLVLGNEEKLDSKNYQVSGVRCQVSGEKAEIWNLKPETSVLVNDIMSVRETASHLVSGFEGRARAFVQVQNGCNHRCTFCIIPYGRGNSRSVAVGEIVTEVRTLAEAGYNEIVLTGVDITDYGLDLPGKPSLGQMMKRLLKLVPELKRLRLSSIDVAEIDNDLLDLIAGEPRLMPHLHLSLQSGDDMILKRMKRRHLRKDILDFCEKARKLRPDVVFGADIIAGFPTETEAMFANTSRIIDEANLTYLHVFPYSSREGTPAAKMPQIAKNIRKERAAELRGKGGKNLAEFLQSRIGKTENIIIEKPGFGRTEHFAPVKLNGDAVSGALARVEISDADAEHLIAA